MDDIGLDGPTAAFMLGGVLLMAFYGCVALALIGCALEDFLYFRIREFWKKFGIALIWPVVAVVWLWKRWRS